MRYSRGYRDYNPMVEKQPSPPPGILAVVLVSTIFSALVFVMVCGWLN